MFWDHTNIDIVLCVVDNQAADCISHSKPLHSKMNSRAIPVWTNKESKRAHFKVTTRHTYQFCWIKFNQNQYFSHSCMFIELNNWYVYLWFINFCKISNWLKIRMWLALNLCGFKDDDLEICMFSPQAMRETRIVFSIEIKNVIINGQLALISRL